MRGLKVVAAMALIAGLAGEARADLHRDEKLGYQFSYPAKWKSMPLDTGTSWVQAQFLSHADYYYQGDKGQTSGNHTPRIDVVIIPLGDTAGKGATVEKTGAGLRIREDLPWKDLKEYLDKTCRNLGGFHFSGEEETTLNEMKLIRYEITVDKLVEAPITVYGWAYYTEDAIYGLVAEILTQEEKKLKPIVMQSFASLKTFARTGALPHTGRTGRDIEIIDSEKKKDRDVTPEELEKERKDAVARRLVQLKDSLPKGWYVIEGKNFIAVSHADQKYTRNLLSHAEGLRDWLEKNLGFCGSGYTGQVIIRICADSDERNSLLKSRAWSADTPEILTYQDKQGWTDWSMESLNRELFYQWMKDKNLLLLWGAPTWIQRGLYDFIEGARTKSGRIEFRADTYSLVEMKRLSRDGKLLHAMQFFKMTGDELSADGDNRQQAGFFVQFLLTGAASRNPRFKGAFEYYVKNLIFHLAEMEDARDAAGGSAAREPTTEEEEAAMFRARQQAFAAAERDTLDKLFKKTFSDWSDKDWEQFNFLYQKDAR